MSLFVPLIIIVIEMCTNKIRIHIGHLSYQFIIFVCYIATTYVGQMLIGRPIYDSTLNYKCAEMRDGCWSALGEYLTLLISLQISFFFVFWGVSYAKWRWCRPSKAMTEPLLRDD